MDTKIISGKEISTKLREKISGWTDFLSQKGIVPGLTVVLVGEDPASVSYVTGKAKACEELGIKGETMRLPDSTTQTELLDLVQKLNQDTSVHGILVQLPLPAHIDEQSVIKAISPEKDVDGFHPVSVGNMVLGNKTFLPCTPHGIIKMLEYSGIETLGKKVCVIGRSNIVGKPVGLLLLQNKSWANATVTFCHSRTKNLAIHTKDSDIIIVATGRPGTLEADMVNPGSVVIDVGVNRIPDETKKRGYRLVGDADYDGLLGIASAITPVPGGVGPMTITMLLYNTVMSAYRFEGLSFDDEE